MRACLASIFDLDIDAIPPFEDAKHDWYVEMQRWCRATVGRKLRLYPAKTPPPGYALMNGPAARGVRHSVVALDGEMVWDPHPSRAGLVETDSYYGFVPFEATATSVEDMDDE